ncbi:MAG: MFS transporter [Alphaproteobacteria bacterium]
MAGESFTAEGVHSFFDGVRGRAIDALGGPARFQVILVMAAVLGLDSADKGTVSAVSDQLKQAFGIGNIEIGLLLAVVSFVGAIATLPMGVLADRVRRRVVLMVTVATWAAAMVACGIATSYWFLLLCRLALGAVTAAAWPCIASMTGDFFPARERPSIFGLILSGELIGAGVGFVIAGEVSTLLGWRWAFHAMALPSLVLVWVIWRYLPEPDRGTQHWLEIGEQDPEAASGPGRGTAPKVEGNSGADELTAVEEKALTARYLPRPEMILREDPTRWGLWRTLSYLLRVPSYRLLIVASMLAYFFFSGMRGFAMIYFTEHFGLSRWLVIFLVIVVGAGAMVGLIVGGRLSERLLDRGRLDSRIAVPAIALFLSIPLLALGIWTTNVWIGLAALTVGAGSLAAALAPIDAARLDIVHPRMWGRGEAGRMTIRSVFEGAAPLLFGAVSRWLGGGDAGLMWTFLIMLIPTASAGFFVLPARRSYPRDVATAAASVQAMANKEQRADDPCR